MLLYIFCTSSSINLAASTTSLYSADQRNVVQEDTIGTGKHSLDYRVHPEQALDLLFLT